MIVTKYVKTNGFTALAVSKAEYRRVVITTYLKGVAIVGTEFEPIVKLRRIL